MLVLIFDTETTGLPKSKMINQQTLDKWPHIVQFSYIIFDTELNEIVSSKDYIIKQKNGLVIPEVSIKIHGISNEMSQEKGQDIEIILKEFFYYLRQVDLTVAHNISFDRDMIMVELLRIIYGRTYPKEHIDAYKSDLHFLQNITNIYCTLQEGVELCNIKTTDKFGKEYIKWPKLSELHQKLFGVIPNNLHNSFIDILVTLRCFMKLKFDKDISKDCKNYKELMNNFNII
jgi:DNA polymerase III epsilon subunit-like protein